MKQLRCVFYVRVSTNNGHQNPEVQLNDMRPFAESRGWQLVGEYIDHVSGSKESRPELNRLMADAKQRIFDVVLVWKIDRFGRSLKHLVNSLSEFDALKVAFVSVKDNLDLTTPSGKAMFGMIAVMAEFERSLIVERVRAGLRNARAKGKVLGRPRASVDPKAVSRTTLWRRARAAQAEHAGASGD